MELNYWMNAKKKADKDMEFEKRKMISQGVKFGQMPEEELKTKKEEAIEKARKYKISLFIQ